MNFIIFLLGSLTVIIGSILFFFNKNGINIEAVSLSVDKIKTKPIGHFSAVILIGLVFMIVGAFAMKGSKVVTLENKIEESKVEIAKLQDKLSGLKTISKEDLSKKNQELETADREIQKLKNEVKELTILSSNERELLIKNYGDLSEDEKLIVNRILNNVNNYNDEDNKIIIDNKDRIEKEKIKFREEEQAKRDQEEKEKGEKEEQEAEKQKEEARKKKEKEEAKKEEEAKSDIEILEQSSLKILRKNFNGVGEVKLVKETKTFTILPTDKSFITSVLLALQGDNVSMDAWNGLVDNFISMSNSIPGYSVSLINPQNHDNVLLSIIDGMVIYDVIND